MPRYRLTIAYDGTPFCGWQRQRNAPSVQQAIEQAIAAFCGESVTLRCAGRTDTGVHALGQVANVDLVKAWPTGTVRDAINRLIRPHPVTILSAERVPESFDARMSATRRHYRYLILDRRAPPALEINRVWHVPCPIDHEAMHDAAQAYIGRHDFTTFRATECQANSPVRTIDSFTVSRDGELLRIETSARAFLQHQVRSMTGALLPVGRGRWQRSDIARILAAADRRQCPALAPPAGLYLTRVDY